MNVNVLQLQWVDRLGSAHRTDCQLHVVDVAVDHMSNSHILQRVAAVETKGNLHIAVEYVVAVREVADCRLNHRTQFLAFALPAAMLHHTSARSDQRVVERMMVFVKLMDVGEKLSRWKRRADSFVEPVKRIESGLEPEVDPRVVVMVGLGFQYTIDEQEVTLVGDDLLQRPSQDQFPLQHLAVEASSLYEQLAPELLVLLGCTPWVQSWALTRQA